MGFGADAAVGSGAGMMAGGAGFSMDAPGGASGVAMAGGGAAIPGASPGTFSGGGGMDFMGMFQQVMKDPETAKAIADTISKLAHTVSAGKKIPPQAQAMIAQSIKQNSQQKQQQDQMNPYMGDITRFMTPEIAQNTLAGMGIPTNRSQF